MCAAALELKTADAMSSRRPAFGAIISTVSALCAPSQRPQSAAPVSAVCAPSEAAECAEAEALRCSCTIAVAGFALNLTMLATQIDRCQRQFSACNQPPWLPDALKLSLSVYNLPQARCRMLEALAGYQPVPEATCTEAEHCINVALLEHQSANSTAAAQMFSAGTEDHFRPEAQPCAAAAELSESGGSCCCSGGLAAHHCSAAAVQLILTLELFPLTYAAEPSPDDSSAPAPPATECSQQATEECLALMAAISRDEGGSGLGAADCMRTPCMLLVARNLVKQLATSCSRFSHTDPQTSEHHILPLQRICGIILDFCPLAAVGASAAASGAKQADPECADEFVEILSSCLADLSAGAMSTMVTCVHSLRNLQCSDVHTRSSFVDVVLPDCKTAAMPCRCPTMCHFLQHQIICPHFAGAGEMPASQ